MRKPYEKPALRFGEVSARQTDTGIIFGVKLNMPRQERNKFYAAIAYVILQTT